MAYELDVSQSNYGRLEKDDRILNIPKVLKIDHFLNMNISMLPGEKAAINGQRNEDILQTDTII